MAELLLLLLLIFELLRLIFELLLLLLLLIFEPFAYPREMPFECNHSWGCRVTSDVQRDV